MFEFFKDIYLESNGIDVQQYKKNKLLQQQEKKKKDKDIIFPKTIKRLIIVMDILYIFIACANIYILVTYGGELLYILKFVFLSLLALSVIVLLMLRNKKAEQIAIILICIFAFVNGFNLIL